MTLKRQFPGVARRIVGVLLCLYIGNSASADPWHPTAEISAAAEAFLAARIQAEGGATTFKATALDERLRLTRCDKPLEGFLRPGTRQGPRTTVGIRCPGAKRWKVYVTVNTIVRSRVLVTRRSLPTGHLLTVDDVRLEERDVSGERQAFLTDPAALLGHRLTMPVLAGRLITHRMLKAEPVIRRGQSVTLVVGTSAIAVNMSGTALADGGMGQRIQVKNSNSGRIVEGFVRSPEHVEVLIPGESGFFHAKPKVSASSADTGSSNNDR